MDDIATHWHAHGCTPHATAWHGGMAGAHAGRGEMHPVFPSCPPHSTFPLSSPLFLFSLVSGCTPSTTLLPLHAPSFLLLVWFSPQSCCSVCHCVIVILTTHSHDVLLPPPLSSFPLPTHQQTALGCEASCTRRAGMLAAPEEDLLTKEHTALPPTPPPFLMSVRTRRCSCRALP